MFILLAIVGLVTALAVVPVDTRPLESHARPIPFYDAAVARAEARAREERDSTMPDARSLLLVHGHATPRSVVLVHGFTNSPRQFRDLAELLFARGDNVYVPRLPAHGLRAGDVTALASVTADQYRDFGDDAIDVASALGDSVMVIGLSAGAVVAIWIAQHRSDVKRVVVIAPALHLARVPRLFDAPVMNLALRLPNFTVHQSPDTLRPHAYFGVSTRAVGEMLRFGATLIRTGDRSAPSVQDLVLVLNGNDHTVDAATALRLASRWREAGAHTTTYQFDRALLLPHDVIDSSQRCGMPSAVYPIVIALLDHQEPPVITRAAPCVEPQRAP